MGEGSKSGSKKVNEGDAQRSVLRDVVVSMRKHDGRKFDLSSVVAVEKYTQPKRAFRALQDDEPTEVGDLLVSTGILHTNSVNINIGDGVTTGNNIGIDSSVGKTEVSGPLHIGVSEPSVKQAGLLNAMSTGPFLGNEIEVTDDVFHSNTGSPSVIFRLNMSDLNTSPEAIKGLLEKFSAGFDLSSARGIRSNPNPSTNEGNDASLSDNTGEVHTIAGITSVFIESTIVQSVFINSKSTSHARATGASSVEPKKFVETVSSRLENTLYGYFIGLEDVLESGPWMIRNSLIILKKWMMNSSLFKEELTRISVWVKIHDVPLQIETAIPTFDITNDDFQMVVNKRKGGKTGSIITNRSGVNVAKTAWQPIKPKVRFKPKAHGDSPENGTPNLSTSAKDGLNNVHTSYKKQPPKVVDIPSSCYTSVTANKGALGWHLEEIHVTWAHLKKKRTRLRLYTIYLKELITLYPIKQGKEVCLAHLKLFGCDSYVKVKDVARDKLDAKSMKCTFIGYGSDVMGYHFWDLKGHKVVRNRDVTFNEDSLYEADAATDSSNLTKLNQKDQVSLGGSLDTSEGSKNSGSFEDNGKSNEEDSKDEASSEEGGSKTVQVRRSSRESKALVRYSLSANYLLLTKNGEPESYSEALSSKESVQWKKDINEEISSLEKNQTWS
ncbi:retrovirus-related pol polyprotein from transposon TNT 1-94 [Tanacetum coccineum]